MKTRYWAQVRATASKWFLAGPRQWQDDHGAADPASRPHWDVPAHRETILRRNSGEGSSLTRYTNTVPAQLSKGLVDEPERKLNILVVGSALDIYRFGGDSCRAAIIFLHPFSTAELKLQRPQELLDLLTLGGFPEPYCRSQRRRAAGRDPIAAGSFARRSPPWNI